MRKRVAAGYVPRKGTGVTEVTVRFDDETFASIRARALSQGTSFAEQVRLLVEWGLETEQ